MLAAADRAAKDKGGKGPRNAADEQEDEDKLDLSQVRLFVLDEADKLIADSGISAVMQVFAKCPGGGSGIHRLQVWRAEINVLVPMQMSSPPRTRCVSSRRLCIHRKFVSCRDWFALTRPGWI